MISAASLMESIPGLAPDPNPCSENYPEAWNETPAHPSLPEHPPFIFFEVWCKEGENAPFYGATLWTSYGDKHPYGKMEPVVDGNESVRERFTGKEYDKDGGTGNGVDGIQLSYFGKRYYDADVGLWTSTDPAEQFWGAYLYCGDNPMMRIDLDGTSDVTYIDGGHEYVFDGKGNTPLYVLDRSPDYIQVPGREQGVSDASWGTLFFFIDPFKGAGKFVEGIAGKAATSLVERYASKSVAKGWKVGDPFTNLTRAGKTPAWSTVRQRFWKNEAFSNKNAYSPENLSRMQRGLAPQRINPTTGKLESMELHHFPPQREGGLFQVQKVWPDEHAIRDPFRFTGQ
jgi:RHS repeat-associated protein